MRDVVLFIAMSLDGYIADPHGDVSWLAGDGSQADHAGSYPHFYASIDTVFLGYTTYDQIRNTLFPEKWYYDDKMSYVFTHKTLPSTDNIVFTNQNPVALLHDLKQQSGNDIWICGGANLANQLVNEDAIDRYHISIIPTILGDGIRLFETFLEAKTLKLIHSEVYNGIVDIVYERRQTH